MEQTVSVSMDPSGFFLKIKIIIILKKKLHNDLSNIEHTGIMENGEKAPLIILFSRRPVSMKIIR